MLIRYSWIMYASVCQGVKLKETCHEHLRVYSAIAIAPKTNSQNCLGPWRALDRPSSLLANPSGALSGKSNQAGLQKDLAQL